MTEIKDSIRSAIQNLIKDNATGAEVDMHPVFNAKIRDAAGITSPDTQSVVSDEVEEE